ncbi:hypothetical protein [Kitasatospora sp. NPDC086791]|uniref:hypothetical protein n=1 Tax=Kitasatospora sp. NPDC086791 TaxID=3155178 RepID=UPI00341DDEED
MVPQIEETTVSYAEVAQSPDSALRLALCVDSAVQLEPGDVLHVALTAEQAGGVIERAGATLGYRVAIRPVAVGGA